MKPPVFTQNVILARAKTLHAKECYCERVIDEYSSWLDYAELDLLLEWERAHPQPVLPPMLERM